MTADHPMVQMTQMTSSFALAATERGPDRLGLHLLLAFGLLLLFIAVVGTMRRAWRARAQRQEEDLPELPTPPERTGNVLAAPLRGMYLGTVDAGHWLERIAARGLGGRANGYVSVYELGVRVDRAGDVFWIPREAVRGARLERAHAGKVSGVGRLIIIAWSYGDRELETGFRGEDRARQPKVVRAVHDLIGPAPAMPRDGDVTSPHAVPRVRARLRPRSPAPAEATRMPSQTAHAHRQPVPTGPVPTGPVPTGSASVGPAATMPIPVTARRGASQPVTPPRPAEPRPGDPYRSGPYQVDPYHNAAYREDTPYREDVTYRDDTSYYRGGSHRDGPLYHDEPYPAPARSGQPYPASPGPVPSYHPDAGREAPRGMETGGPMAPGYPGTGGQLPTTGVPLTPEQAAQVDPLTSPLGLVVRRLEEDR